MAAAALFNVVGLVSGVLTTVGFSMDQASGGGMESSQGATPVTVRVGLNNGDLDGSQGKMPRFTSYNANGDNVGGSNLADGSNANIGDGSYATTYVSNNGGQQFVALDVEATNDAICVASISIGDSGPEGLNYAWLGDAGKFCDQRWCPSKITINSDGYQPACTFIDGDHTDGTKSSAVYIHFPDFYVPDDGQIDDPESKDVHCNRPAIEFNNDGASKKLRRQADQVSQWLGQLVVSNSTQWSADHVCESEFSYGPDYISTVDGLFCNMLTKETMPLCSFGEQDDCFDLDGLTSNGTVAKRNVATTSAYTTIRTWDFPSK